MPHLSLVHCSHPKLTQLQGRDIRKLSSNRDARCRSLRLVGAPSAEAMANKPNNPKKTSVPTLYLSLFIVWYLLFMRVYLRVFQHALQFRFQFRGDDVLYGFCILVYVIRGDFQISGQV